MSSIPPSIAAFLAGDSIVVAGVSRSGNAPANHIVRKLAASGRNVIPLNPNARELEGRTCYPDLASIPVPVHAVLIATHPSVAIGVVKEALGRGVRHIWFHRSFGEGSVDPQGVHECFAHGVEPIVGGCPLMYCAPVDVVHRCMRWWLGWRDRVPHV